jgi:ribosomal protein S18 acetylase RimI-like enzyme
LLAVIATVVSATGKNLPVKMTRANLDNLPEFALPSGFALRWYQSGDETHWLRIHLVADHFNKITPELFQEQFAVEEESWLPPTSTCEHRSEMNSAPENLRKRQCYLLDPRGEAIGTATAWFDDNFQGARWGRVHWLAIIPEFQGQGLGKALLSAICRRLRELRHERAYLTTSAARVPAIKLYCKFGFEPLIRNIEDESLWREIVRLAKR